MSADVQVITRDALNSQTLGEYMASIKGFTSGFDYLRFILALAVLVWHSYPFTQGGAAADEMARGWVSNLTFLILPMFFALSGFLVSTSLQRTPTIWKFLWLRAIRIVPALFVEVMLSALILGPLLTVLPLSEYFSSETFYRYFLNIIGYIHYELPGVFESNPYAKIVNGSLWTVPFELECYLALTVLALIGMTKRPLMLLGLLLLVTVSKSISTYYFGASPMALSHIGGRQLILFFLAGIIINLNRDRIPLNGLIALMCAIVGFLFLRNEHLLYIAPLPIAYVTVWIGMLRPPKIPVVMDGDYSYGIYLYAAVVQQTVVNSFSIGQTYIGNVIISIILVSAFAAFSWHAIEKPMLRLKNAF